MATNSEKKLPAVLTRLYAADTGDWQRFGKEANIFDKARYELVAVTPLGTKSFGAVWKSMVVESTPSPDPLGVSDEDDFPLDDMWEYLD